jgi:hypothetical protein
MVRTAGLHSHIAARRQLSFCQNTKSSLEKFVRLTPSPPPQDGMEIRYPGMVDAGKLTQTPLGRALERQRETIAPKEFQNLLLRYTRR